MGRRKEEKNIHIPPALGRLLISQAQTEIEVHQKMLYRPTTLDTIVELLQKSTDEKERDILLEEIRKLKLL